MLDRADGGCSDAVTHQSCTRNRASDLSDDVADRIGSLETSGGDKGERDRRVEVAPADMSDRAGHTCNGKPMSKSWHHQTTTWNHGPTSDGTHSDKQECKSAQKLSHQSARIHTNRDGQNGSNDAPQGGNEIVFFVDWA